MMMSLALGRASRSVLTQTPSDESQQSLVANSTKQAWAVVRDW